MFEKLKMSIKRMAAYVLILTLGLPLSLFVASVKPVQASDAPKKASVQKVAAVKVTPTPQVSAKPIQKLAFTSGPVGLFRANTYVSGQSISMQITIAGEPSSVWAETAGLDPKLPTKINFSSQGQGKWNLITPKLSSDIFVGSHIIKIFAQDANGKTIETEVKIVLQQLKAVTISSYKIGGDGTVSIVWSPISWADAYLVNWQIQDNNSSNNFEVSKSNTTTIKNLEPGTSYSVTIQPLRGDAVGPVRELIFKTLGNAPQVLSAEQAPVVTPAPIAPSIGTGISTSQKIAQTVPQATPQVTPKVETPVTPSPTPSEEAKTTAGGWSKLLVALSIIIIAAGAAIGGYYGYEWLMLKSKDKEPPETGSRW